MSTEVSAPRKIKKSSELKRRTPASWFIFFGMLFTVILWLFPFWMAVVNSVKTEAEFIANGPLGWPQDITFDNVTNFWRDAQFPRKLWNSFFVSTIAATISVVLSFLTAYAIGIGRIKGRTWILAIFMIAFTIPQEAMIYPMYIMSKEVGLYDNLWSIIIIFGVLQSAFGTYLLSSVLSEFPEEVLEAARIDGASSFQLLTKIVLPIVRPTLLVLLTFIFIWDWNEFLLPLILLPSNDNQTVALAMGLTTGQWATDPTAKAAAALLGALPSFIFFMIFQRTLMRGVTMGSVK